MNTPARTDARGGAALIIALVLLVALALLGLPFLFSQSASLSGSRSLARSQAVAIGRDAAETLGIEAQASAIGAHFLVGGTQARHNLPEDLATYFTSAIIPTSGGNGWWLPLSTLGYNPTPAENATLIGTVISDEYAKLDPNHLDARGWTRLFNAIGINDWDDDDVIDSDDRAGEPVESPTDGDSDGLDGLDNGDNDDDDDGDGNVSEGIGGGECGELAEALALVRFT
ncbi:MAG: hypothetical protein H0W72_16315, partial [Planctomycetes bacterium]|nr:hypothetical protein [Planctomycetota bacterium]